MDKNEDLAWAPAPGHGPEVVYAVDGPLGRARLNRPRTINALDRASIDSLFQQLTTWAGDDSVSAVVLDGAGDRGLCAGGDVRALRESVLAGRHEEAVDYWRAEYGVNALVADYPKPYVAWMDGIVMGGGVGVSAHGSLRVVTERTQLAMPETIIGFFPDVGGLQLLAHAPGQLGTHVALTGTALGGADALVLGAADVLLPADAKEQVLGVLREDCAVSGDELATAVGSGARHSSGGSWLEENRAWIDECYVGDDAGVILARLSGHAEPAAREAASSIGARSPHSVAVTLEAIRRAASMTVGQVLSQDLALGPAFARHPDFAEGVRAQLVDKDRRPRWTHASVADVSRAEVLRAFDGG
ncbi:3-hydroxyisobutyryl-CoA hydrolase [Ornithinimicrobium sp. LYQ121]|uniref:3-hydroxyisobutyryl-CoA hydrolase n=1 Tax=Ornithinimicrobium sp. LYQ121 TaxID=3378801 RepID=UPI0038537FF9